MHRHETWWVSCHFKKKKKSQVKTIPYAPQGVSPSIDLSIPFKLTLAVFFLRNFHCALDVSPSREEVEEKLPFPSIFPLPPPLPRPVITSSWMWRVRNRTFLLLRQPVTQMYNSQDNPHRLWCNPAGPTPNAFNIFWGKRTFFPSQNERCSLTAGHLHQLPV